MSKEPIKRFLLQVDGVGSYLVINSDVMTIGPIASGDSLDLPLMMEPAFGITTIERDEDDFFIESRAPLTVNHEPQSQAMLHHEDEIKIGPRCGLRFTVPNPASSTALIEFKSARAKRLDLRGALLCDGAIVIAGHAGAHIPCYDACRPIVLRFDNKGMTLRYNDDQEQAQEQGVSIGQYLRLGAVGIAISEG